MTYQARAVSPVTHFSYGLNVLCSKIVHFSRRKVLGQFLFACMLTAIFGSCNHVQSSKLTFFGSTVPLANLTLEFGGFLPGCSNNDLIPCSYSGNYWILAVWWKPFRKTNKPHVALTCVCVRDNHPTKNIFETINFELWNVFCPVQFSWNTWFVVSSVFLLSLFPQGSILYVNHI